MFKSIYKISSDKLNIAFRTNGGMGNVLICANYIKYFAEKIVNKHFRLDVFGHPSMEITNAIFHNQQYIDNVYGYLVATQDIIRMYDMFIDLHTYPHVTHLNNARIDKFYQPYLNEIHTVWKTFRNVHKPYFDGRPAWNYQSYKYNILNGKNCVNAADIDGYLGIPKEFSIDISVSDDSILCQHELQDKPFITIQRGLNPFANTLDSPKLWPLKHYNRLIALMKSHYPNICLVQLGESPERCQSFDNVDVNLVGQTSFEDVKILLKNAFLHIDGECGMVHLRRALGGGTSVVLFGPTPVEYYGHAENINLLGKECPGWCAGLTRSWQRHCLRDINPAPCMESLSPEMVFETIDSHLHEKF